jgi:hypothetical protein
MLVKSNLLLVRLETLLVSVHGLHQRYHRLRKSFWTHPMVLHGDEAQVEARFGTFADSANLDA